MKELFAHSARPSLNISAQPYSEHIQNVIRQACKNVKGIARYFYEESQLLVDAVHLAAEFHDLGKLDTMNQNVLSSNSSEKRLPIHHWDAGVAHILNPSVNNLLAATLAYSHHVGLPDFQVERNNPAGFVLRDTTLGPCEKTIKEITDIEINNYLKLHSSVIQLKHQIGKNSMHFKLNPLLFRIALSCLVDADHGDTASNYGQMVPNQGPVLWPNERLALLNAHIEFLTKTNTGSRTALRRQVYEACRDADSQPGMYACDSPVGTGKTTAVMAHLLHVAAEKNLRRIFVVLPFTNIIDQSVETYRRALVGLGERAEDVVGAHHHKAEFEDAESRQFTFLWHSPIVVTTAVQFFETLASNRPASLRKLHQLPGSAIFIDEAHAALPAHLWPQGWRWLQELESQWGCHIVLGSGSLSRFWELEEFSNPPAIIPELVSSTIRDAASNYEGHRVQYQSKPDVLGLEELITWVQSLEGPRLLIVNTVQSAAVIASEIAKKFGQRTVEHLSTALCPRDRKRMLDRVKSRLDDEKDIHWTLVATSCIEAGVDLSFRTGIRERCSLNSLIQIGGRVNRSGKHKKANVWDICLRHGGLLRSHPAFDTSSRVLGGFIEHNYLKPEYCTEAMRNEVRSDGMRRISKEIVLAEQNLQFPLVAEKFHVIDSDTVTAIVDEELIKRLEEKEKVDMNLIQAMSVQIWGYQKGELALRPISGLPGMYGWSLLYDSFLGYMAGVLQVEAFKIQGGSVV